MDSDDDWDKDDFEPPVLAVVGGATKKPEAPTKTKKSWDDSDSDDEPSTPSASTSKRWDDDDLFNDKPKEKVILKGKGSKAAPPAKVAAPAKAAKAAPVKAAAKAAPKPTPAPVVETSVDPITDKLRKQKLIEKSDLKNARDLFGIDSDEEEEEETPVPRVVSNAKDLLDTAAPRTEADFENLAANIVDKLIRLESSPHYSKFLRALVRQFGLKALKLTPEDFKELGKVANIVANEKIALEKKGQKKKTQTKKPPPKDLMDDFVEGEFATFEKHE